jgi:putative OPT family oligopeptide transporter
LKNVPFIKPDENVVELSIRCVVLAIVLTIVLAMSNAYLALKIGMLTSASIPAAVISMAILRFFKNSSVLENNLVQTAASAGEAVAGGIVYTIPALIIIKYWTDFSYWENFFIAAIGGTLGVIFSVPLRKVLVKQPELPFPEGKAIAEVLKASSNNGSVKELLIGGGLGAILEFMQVGLKVIANNYQVWFTVKRTIWGFGVGFSATLIGAGYLIGFELCLSILLGAVVGWLFAVPIFSELYPNYHLHYLPVEAVHHLWNAKIRYLGIGAMLFSGLWAFLKMLGPLCRSIYSTSSSVLSPTNRIGLPRTEKDIPFVHLMLMASILSAVMFIFFQAEFPIANLGFNYNLSPTIIFLFVIYVFVIGFLFAVITAFFSGLVGVTASPGSSIIIAGMLLLGWLLSSAMTYVTQQALTLHQIQAAEAVTIIIGSVVTGIAAISNDNMQDLKVGYILGATPWKQQIMLLLGVFVAALVIPPIMQLLYNVYGIAGIVPRPHMDPALSLPAPPAALMAAITQAAFNFGLPWKLLCIGAMLAIGFLLVQWLVAKKTKTKLSVLGFAIGIYLPMTSTIPLFIGGCLSLIIHKKLKNNARAKQISGSHKGMLLACGLVAGAALMDVLLAIPFSLSHSSSVLQLDVLIWDGSALGFGILSTLLLCWYFIKTVCQAK